jgi:hypothetical protein
MKVVGVIGALSERQISMALLADNLSDTRDPVPFW